MTALSDTCARDPETSSGWRIIDWDIEPVEVYLNQVMMSRKAFRMRVKVILNYNAQNLALAYSYVLDSAVASDDLVQGLAKQDARLRQVDFSVMRA